MKRRIEMIACCVLVLAAGDTSAQALPDTLLDHRVRVHLARQDRSLEGAVGRQMLRGMLTNVGDDSITVNVHPAAAPVRIAKSGIYQIDVSRGVSGSRTALRRGLTSAAVWAGLAAMNRDEGTQDILLWAGGGLVFGAILGAVFPEEYWSRVFHR